MDRAVSADSAADVVAHVAQLAGRLSGVVAVSLGGSVGSGLADAASDLDFYVYWVAPLAAPDERAKQLATVANADSIRVGDEVTSWTLEDSFAVGGHPVELIYVRWSDVTNEIEWAYREGLAEEGFSTARLYNVALGRAVHDPAGVLGVVQEQLNHAYPEATRAALVRRQPARLDLYLRQLRGAQRRGDLLFVQHARAKLQIIFFDLLFALNRLYHPGEKRLLAHLARCPMQPADCAGRWERLTRLSADAHALTTELGALVDELCDLARRQGSEHPVDSMPP